MSQCLTVVSTYDTPSGNGLDSTIWIPTDKSVMQSADVANRMVREYVSVGFQKWVLVPQVVTILLLLSRAISHDMIGLYDRAMHFETP